MYQSRPAQPVSKLSLVGGTPQEPTGYTPKKSLQI